MQSEVSDRLSVTFLTLEVIFASFSLMYCICVCVRETVRESAHNSFL